MIARAAPLLRRYRLGLALFCSAIVMLFVAFSSAYVVRRGIPTYDLATGTYSTAWEPVQLPTALLRIGTLVLLAASGTMELARRSLRGVRSFVIISAVLIAGFVGILGAAWHDLRSSGHFMNSGAQAAFFYVFTGTQAGLALLGVAALACLGFCQHAWSTKGQSMAVDLTAWYVHFVALLWIYVLSFLLFA